MCRPVCSHAACVPLAPSALIVCSGSRAYVLSHPDVLASFLPMSCKAAPGIKLYQFIKAGSGGKWELTSLRACPGFYDANEDARGKQPDFWLEVDAGDIDTRADDALSYVADPAARRVTFAANEGLWALKFPSAESYRAFMTELEVGVGLCMAQVLGRGLGCRLPASAVRGCCYCTRRVCSSDSCKDSGSCGSSCNKHLCLCCLNLCRCTQPCLPVHAKLPVKPAEGSSQAQCSLAVACFLQAQLALLCSSTCSAADVHTTAGPSTCNVAPLSPLLHSCRTTCSRTRTALGVTLPRQTRSWATSRTSSSTRTPAQQQHPWRCAGLVGQCALPADGTGCSRLASVFGQCSSSQCSSSPDGSAWGWLGGVHCMQMAAVQLRGGCVWQAEQQH